MPPAFSRYVALGDSTTEGLDDPYPDGTPRGWADRLADRLAGIEPGLGYANLAIRGRKIPQIRAEQLEPALALRPDLASIVGGLNDILRRSVALDRVCADLEAMVAALRGQGATVTVMTYPDPTAVISIAGERVRLRVAAFNERVRVIAAEHGAVLVDIDRAGIAHPALWSADRLHANALGHERIARAAATALGLPAELDPEPLPDPVARPRHVQLAVDAAWAGRHLAPWVVRRLRRRSSGDGREPKRPELAPAGGATGRAVEESARWPRAST